MSQAGEAPVRLLVVDDDSVFLMGIKRMLRDLPCDVELFEAPELALDQLAASPPALILVDLHMPRMSGLEFLRKARLALDASTTRIYLQSAGRATPEVMAEVEQLGAELVDKGTVLDRRWLKEAVERCEEELAAVAGKSAGKVA